MTAFMSNNTLPALRMAHFCQAYVQNSTQNDSVANRNVFLQVFLKNNSSYVSDWELLGSSVECFTKHILTETNVKARVKWNLSQMKSCVLTCLILALLWRLEISAGLKCFTSPRLIL